MENNQYTNSGNIIEVRTPETTVKFDSAAEAALAKQRDTRAKIDEITLNSMKRGFVLAPARPSYSGEE